jgi:hypothetical protein
MKTPTATKLKFFDGGHVIELNGPFRFSEWPYRMNRDSLRWEITVDGIVEYLGPKFIEPLKEIRSKYQQF